MRASEHFRRKASSLRDCQVPIANPISVNARTTRLAIYSLIAHDKHQVCFLRRETRRTFRVLRLQRNNSFALAFLSICLFFFPPSPSDDIFPLLLTFIRRISSEISSRQIINFKRRIIVLFLSSFLSFISCFII